MHRLDPGVAFGPYVIEGYIAGGGMGEVYAARHGVYGSPVAVKLLHASLHADDSWRNRFNEEAIIGQRLKHPHVIAARELIEAHGRVGVVMDLVRGGQTLNRVVSREFPDGLPVVQALQVLLGILQGVEYAHEREIVHGDLKPENVMIKGDFRDATTWVPMVTDFGTVGLMAHPVVIHGKTAVVVSPKYASPEHMLGVDQLEVRSDIYCLGLLLHFLLTGLHASPARDVNEAAEWVAQPQPVGALADQPEGVLELFQQATAVSPEDRFGSCRAFALAVRGLLDDLGARLNLEDLKEDLATEVIEERQRRAQEAEDAQVETAGPEVLEPDHDETEPAPPSQDEVDPPRPSPGGAGALPAGASLTQTITGWVLFGLVPAVIGASMVLAIGLLYLLFA